MAKKRDEFDLDDDDLDLGGDFDDAFGEFDEEMGDHKKRNPVARLGGKFLGGIKDTVFSKPFQKEMISKNLPDGYSTAFDTVDQTIMAGQDLYNTAREGAETSIKELKKGAKILSKEMQGKHTKRLGDWLARWGDDGGDRYDDTRVDPEMAAIAAMMGDIFAEKQAEMNNQDPDRPATKKEARETEFQEEQVKGQVQSNMHLGMMNRDIQLMRENTDRLVSYQDQVTDKFRKKLLEISIRQYFTQRKIADATQQSLEMSKSAFEKLIHNTNLPDIVKMKNMELGHQLMKEKFFGNVVGGFSDRFANTSRRIIQKGQREIKRFFADLGSNISMGVDGLQGVVDQFGSGSEEGMGQESMSEMLVGLAGGAAASKGGSWLSKKLGKRLMQNERLAKNGLAIGNFINNFSRTFNEALTSDTGNPWLEMLKFTGFLDEFRYNPSDTVRTDATQELDKVSAFDLQTKKTITEIIPRFLAKIHAETASMRKHLGAREIDELQYSFKTGMFTTRKKVAQEIKESILDEGTLKNQAAATNRLIGDLDPEGKLSKPAREALARYFGERARSGRDYQLFKLASGNAEGLKASPDVTLEIAALVKDHFGFTDEQIANGDESMLAQIKQGLKGGLAQQQAMKKFQDNASRLNIEYTNKSHEMAINAARSGHMEELVNMGLVTMDHKSGTARIDHTRLQDEMVGYLDHAGTQTSKEIEQEDKDLAQAEKIAEMLKGKPGGKKWLRVVELKRAKTPEERQKIAERHKKEDEADPEAAAAEGVLARLAGTLDKTLRRAGYSGDFSADKLVKDLKKEGEETIKKMGLHPDSEQAKSLMQKIFDGADRMVTNLEGIAVQDDETANASSGGIINAMTNRAKKLGQAFGKEARAIITEDQRIALEHADAVQNADQAIAAMLQQSAPEETPKPKNRSPKRQPNRRNNVPVQRNNRRPEPKGRSNKNGRPAPAPQTPDPTPDVEPATTSQWTLESAEDAQTRVVNERAGGTPQNHTGGIVGDPDNKMKRVGIPRYHSGGVAGALPNGLQPDDNGETKVEILGKGFFRTTAPDGKQITWRNEAAYKRPRDPKAQQRGAEQVRKQHDKRYGHLKPAPIQSDEVVTILQRGEEVLTANDPRHQNNIENSVQSETKKSELVEKLTRNVKNAGSKLTGLAKNHAPKAFKKLESTGEAALGGIKKIFAKKEEAVEPEFVGPMMPMLGQANVDFTGPLLPGGLKSKVPTMYDHISYMRLGQDEMIELLKIIAEKAGGTEPGIFSRLWDWSKKKAQWAKEGIYNGFEMARTQMSKAVEKLRKFFPNLPEHFKDLKLLAGLHLQNAKLTIQKHLPKLKEKFEQTKEWVVDKKEKTVEWAKKKWEALKELPWAERAKVIAMWPVNKVKQFYNWAKDNVPGIGRLIELAKSLKDKLPSLDKIKDFGRRSIEFGKEKLHGLGEFLKEKFPTLGKTVSSAWNRIKHFRRDIYVKDNPVPLITEEQLKSGTLIDANSLTIVNKLEDITGPVVSSAGIVMVDTASFEKGLSYGTFGQKVKEALKSNYRNIRDFVKDPIGGMKAVLRGLKRETVNDLYLKDGLLPIIFKGELVDGKYFDVNTRKRVFGLQDITGSVCDEDGNYIITEEQFAMGVEDRSTKLQKFGQFTAKVLHKPLQAVADFVKGDIYVIGEKDPILTAKDLRLSYYYDQKTNKQIHSIKDITGPVCDINGNVVLTQEQFDKGIEDRLRAIKILGNLGNAALGFARKGLDFIKKAKVYQTIKNAVDDKITGFINERMPACDVYVVGEEKARLTFISMVQGKYFNEDGSVVKNIATAKLPIKDAKGNTLLSEEDVKTGLRDGRGRELRIGKGAYLDHLGRKAVDKVGGFLKKAATLGKKVWNGVKTVADTAWGIVSLRPLRRWFSGRKAGKMSPTDVMSMTNELDVQKATLINVIAIKDHLQGTQKKEKKKPFWDTDGDGVREGSQEDQKKKSLLARLKDSAKEKTAVVKEKVKEKAASAWDFLSGLMPKGLLGLIASGGLGAFLMNKFVGDGQFSWGKTAAGAVAGIAGVKAATALGGMAARGIAKGAGMLASGAKTVAVEGAKKVGTFALQRALPWLASTAMPAIGNAVAAGASALAGVISAPVLLAAGAIALAAYGGYKLYKAMTTKKLPIAKLRMAQYGFKQDDEKHVVKILELEKKLMPNTQAFGGKAKILPGLEASECFELFGVNPEKEKEVKNWLKWFHYRFKPVYLSHMTALYKTTRRSELHKADELMGRTEKLAYLKAVHYKNGKASPYTIDSDPFNEWHIFGGLLDNDDVDDVYEDVVEWAEDEPEKTGNSSVSEQQQTKEEKDKKDGKEADKSADRKRKEQESNLKTEQQKQSSLMSRAWEMLKMTNPLIAPAMAAKSLVDGFLNPDADNQNAVNRAGGALRHFTNDLGLTSNASSLNKSQKEYQWMVFQAFKNAGFSDNQALALTAEVGRENDYKERHLFGVHGDPANGKVNQGFFSWQGSRREKLFQQMARAGLVDAKQNFIPGQESLNQMALFAKQEMETSYKKTREQFLQKPDIDLDVAASILGHDYIRWAMDSPTYGPNGNRRRKSHLASAIKQVKEHTGQEPGKQQSQSTTPTTTKSPTIPLMMKGALDQYKKPESTGMPVTAADIMGSQPTGTPTPAQKAASNSPTGAPAPKEAPVDSSKPNGAPTNKGRVTEVPRGSMPDRAADHCAAAAGKDSTGYCARYVNAALAKAGYKVNGGHAYQYPEMSLIPAGFKQIPLDSPRCKGDVMCWTRTKRHKYGHVQIWVGDHWVSDFHQYNKTREHPWPSGADGSVATLWRDGNLLSGAKATTGNQTSTQQQSAASPATTTNTSSNSSTSSTPSAKDSSPAATKGQSAYSSMPSVYAQPAGTPNGSTPSARAPKPISAEASRTMLVELGKRQLSEQVKTNVLLERLCKAVEGGKSIKPDNAQDKIDKGASPEISNGQYSPGTSPKKSSKGPTEVPAMAFPISLDYH